MGQSGTLECLPKQSSIDGFSINQPLRGSPMYGNPHISSGKYTKKTVENHQLSIGKSTISTGPFSMANC